MHFEVLVEDLSGKIALQKLIPKIVDDSHTFRVISYNGIGHLPKKGNSAKILRSKMLLNNLPKLLEGYKKTYSSLNQVAIIVVCDLDDKCLKVFREELLLIRDKCSPSLLSFFCIAVEEGEAWFLGDPSAVQKAFPKAKIKLIENYINDSIVGTWELLADIVYPGGKDALVNRGPQAVGQEKAVWAENIPDYMNINNNNSPSFNYFVSKIRHAAGL
jgi:hypothetical protein